MKHGNEGAHPDMALVHQGPKRKYAKNAMAPMMRRTIVHLTNLPQGIQEQHSIVHATDARSAAPTKNSGYLSQSGTFEVPSAATPIISSRSINRESLDIVCKPTLKTANTKSEIFLSTCISIKLCTCLCVLV